MSKNAIFISFNEKYVKYAVPLINSIKLNWNTHPVILCYCSEISEQSISKLSSYTNLKIINVDKEKFGTTGDKIAFFRFIIWTEEFSEYDNILYLDADVLVLKPLDELINATEFMVFKDRDKKPDFNFFKSNIKENVDELLEKDDLSEFISDKSNLNVDVLQSGVFLVPKKYRTNTHYSYLMYLSDRYGKLVNRYDQPILNMWVVKNKIPINHDIRFNYRARHLNKTYALEDLYITHFTKGKPLDNNFLTNSYYKGISSELYELYQFYSNLNVT